MTKKDSIAQNVIDIDKNVKEAEEEIKQSQKITKGESKRLIFIVALILIIALIVFLLIYKNFKG